MKNLFTIFGTVLCLGIFSLNAQPRQEGIPPSFNLKEISPDFDVRELAKPELKSIRLEDELRAKQGIFYRVGVSVPVNANLNNTGTWTVLPNGDRIWRLKLHAPDAQAIGVYYSHFWLPAGAKLFLYDENNSQVKGAYTEANNPDNSYFANELIRGESVILEYFEPSGANGRSVIDISEIAYIYRGMRYHFPGNLKDYGDSDASCEVNINCPEGANWQDQKKGVARIFLKAGSNYGWCSGSLVNNVRLDCTPYFLTADHCGENSSTSDLTQWVFYFNYEAPTCNYSGAEPSSNTITGCTLKASGGNGGSDGSDFFLVQLSTAPSFNPFYNGWDNNNTASPSGFGIHHPMGDIKKISTYTTTLVSASWGGTVPNTHWQVVWAATTSGHGVTEPGSSGSPIFNNTGHIVGDLTGGGSYCTTPNDPDMFGKFSYSWSSNGTTPATRLKDWLDPDNTGATTLDGFYCGTTPTLHANFTANVTFIPVGGSVNFTDLSTGSPTSWHWTFNGGTPGASTTQNPSNIVYNTAGTYTVSLKVSNNTGSDSATKINYITVGGINPGGSSCDTLNYPLPGNLVLYSVRYPGGIYGYISGNDGYSDKAKANYFVPMAPYVKLVGAYMKFGKAVKTSASTENVIFVAWDNTGPGGTPGALLATDTMYLGNIVPEVSGHQMTYVQFKPQVILTSPFYVGLYLPSVFGDTLALLTNKNGQSMPGTAWEQWQSGIWYPYYDSSSWGYNLSHAIFPQVCKQDYAVEEISNASHVIVYPNPATGEVTVDFGSQLNGHIAVEVYNIIGSLVGNYKYDGLPANTFRVDLSGNPSGLYFLKIRAGNNFVTRKVTLMK